MYCIVFLEIRKIDHVVNFFSTPNLRHCSLIFPKKIQFKPLYWLRVSKTNVVPISSHIWVTSTTFKRLWKRSDNFWNPFLWPVLDQLNRLRRWTGPAWPWRSVIAYFSESINGRDTIFIQFSNLCYSNLGSIYLIVWQLCA